MANPYPAWKRLPFASSVGIARFGAAAVIASSYATAAPALDAFGILRFHPARQGTREWNSAHWGNGVARLIGYSGDPYDPTGWTDNHSSSSGDSLYVDGKGSLLINGGGPRFHVNSPAFTREPRPRPRFRPRLI